MKNSNNQNENQETGFAARFSKGVIKRRWLIIIGSLVLTFLLSYGAQFIRFNSDYHVFFGDDNPQVKAYDDLQKKFTTDENVFIALKPEDGNVFTPSTLAAIEDLVKEAWKTPYSTRVDAVSNFQKTTAYGDSLRIQNLVRNAMDLTPAELAKIKRIATTEPMLLNRLINKEGSVTGINIITKVPPGNETAGIEIAQFVRNITASFEEKNPGIKSYLSGMMMMDSAFQESAQNDMATLIPAMLLIVLIVIFFATRSFSAAFSTLIIIILSVFVAMGLTGSFGIQLTTPSASATTIIMTIAIADCIHVLVSFMQYLKQGLDKKEAARKSLAFNLLPITVTSLTTVIGFLTLNFSDVPPYADLGNITAFGLMAAYLFSITTLPALISVLPIRKSLRTKKEIKNSWLNNLANFVIAYPKKILISSLLLLIGFSYLAFQNVLNDEFVKYFSENIKFRTDTDFISDNLTGVYNIEYSLPAGASGGVNEPEYLKHLGEFEQWLYQQDEVVHVNSYAEIARQVNQFMHGGDRSYYKLPDDRKEAAQYLLVHEMSLPFGLDLNDRINIDKSESRLTLTLKDISSAELLAFAGRSEDWLKNNAPEYMFTHGTSTSVIFSHLSKRQVDSMLTGILVALITISIVLMFVFRSVKYGLMSLIPNLAPLLFGFGAWALIGGVINVGIAIVFGMTLGIIVDDTVYFLSKYLKAYREKGWSAEASIRYAFSSVGNALLTTTFALVLGFGVLTFSDFGMNSDMAIVTILIISAALIFDLLFFSALLLVMSPKKENKMYSEKGTVGSAVILES